MTLVHAVIRIDHEKADIIRFDATTAQVSHVKSHSHTTGQHGSAVRDVHEFFAEVCKGLAPLEAILVVGNQTSLSDFRHYVEKHRPALVDTIIAYERVDHISEAQLVAFARAYVEKYERMA